MNPFDLPFRPVVILNHFFPEVKKASEINYGSCFRWAWIAHKLFAGVELWANESHAMIRYKDRFYDSEDLTGSRHWSCLRTFTNGFKEKPIRMSPIAFQRHWSKLNEVNWNQLDESVAKFVSSRPDLRKPFKQHNAY